MGLGYFDSETAASSTFGSVVCLAGILGTPLGGFLLDYRLNGAKSKEKTSSATDDASALESAVVTDVSMRSNGGVDDSPTVSPHTLQCVTEIATIGTLIGAVFLCSVYMIYNRVLYLFLVTLGCLLIFLCSPSVNIGIMMSVPDENRCLKIFSSNSLLKCDQSYS